MLLLVVLFLLTSALFLFIFAFTMRDNAATVRAIVDMHTPRRPGDDRDARVRVVSSTTTAGEDRARVNAFARQVEESDCGVWPIVSNFGEMFDRRPDRGALDAETKLGSPRYVRRRDHRLPERRALVFVHGGGLIAGDPELSNTKRYFEALVANAPLEYTSFYSLRYCLAPRNRAPSALLDLVDLMRDVMLDGNDRAVVYGYSAGAFLAFQYSVWESRLLARWCPATTTAAENDPTVPPEDRALGVDLTRYSEHAHLAAARSPPAYVFCAGFYRLSTLSFNDVDVTPYFHSYLRLYVDPAERLDEHDPMFLCLRTGSAPRVERALLLDISRDSLHSQQGALEALLRLHRVPVWSFRLEPLDGRGDSMSDITVDRVARRHLFPFDTTCANALITFSLVQQFLRERSRLTFDSRV